MKQSVVNLTCVASHLRLALRDQQSRCPHPPHPRAETDPVSETLCFLFVRIPDDAQSPKTQSVFLSVMHHRGKYLEYAVAAFYRHLTTNHEFMDARVTDGVRSTHGVDEKCVYKFEWKACQENKPLGRRCVQVMVLLKWSL
jgi:hypothetical protein